MPLALIASALFATALLAWLINVPQLYPLICLLVLLMGFLIGIPIYHVSRRDGFRGWRNAALAGTVAGTLLVSLALFDPDSWPILFTLGGVGALAGTVFHAVIVTAGSPDTGLPVRTGAALGIACVSVIAALESSGRFQIG